jgi:hypothetical protein
MALSGSSRRHLAGPVDRRDDVGSAERETRVLGTSSMRVDEFVMPGAAAGGTTPLRLVDGGCH